MSMHLEYRVFVIRPPGHENKVSVVRLTSEEEAFGWAIKCRETWPDARILLEERRVIDGAEMKWEPFGSNDPFTFQANRPKIGT